MSSSASSRAPRTARSSRRRGTTRRCTRLRRACSSHSRDADGARSLEQALRIQAEHNELVLEHNLLIATTVAARQSLAAEGVDPITTSLTQLADQASSSISALHADVAKLEAEKTALVEQNESVESARVKAEACVRTMSYLR